MSVKVKLMWCPAGGKVKRQCSHNHWVGKIASVLVASWVSHDRSWVSLSVFIFVMWERSPGWRHLVSQSSGQAFPFKVPRLLSASSPGFRDRWLWNKTTNLTDHSPHISLLGMMSTQHVQTWHTWKMGDAALSSCFTGGKCCPGLDRFKLSLSFRRCHWGAQLQSWGQCDKGDRWQEIPTHFWASFRLLRTDVWTGGIYR